MRPIRPASPAGPSGGRHPHADDHLRIARPTRDLDAAERFWVDGLGLGVLWRTEGEHALVMVGWPEAAWHLELVADPSAAPPSPTDEDLLVLYLDEELPEELHARLLAAGGRRVRARNPYWEEHGRTYEDPDGYRLVLSTRAWP